MKAFGLAGLLCIVLSAGATGCRNSAVEGAIPFDNDGWGGPNLAYTYDRAKDCFTVRNGMLMSRDFRWAGSDFSFEFLDTRELVWGFRLLDKVFSAERRAALGLVKIGEKKYAFAKDLPADQMWKFDTMLDVVFTLDTRGRGYKVLVQNGYVRLLDRGRRGARVRVTHDVRIKRNTWNRFSARVAGGKITYSINGEQAATPLQVDARADGRLGVYLETGGPLLIRNLKLSAGSTP